MSVKRRPWKPELGGDYYYIQYNTGVPVRTRYTGTTNDFVLYKIGNCYRTKEEAEADREKWISFYKSDDVLKV